ncbi:head-tail adaptor protein, partial [Nostoc sp. HG1]|nr:head-tail adaptor protein [Nostoc sp. HG1]
MRAGKLDKTITIEHFEPGQVNEDNEPIEDYQTLGTFRAEILQGSNEEFFRAQGVVETNAVVFRTRFIAGLGLADRITYAGEYYNIREIK